MTRRARAAATLIVVLGASGCASALKEPPPISELQRAALSPASASDLLAEGRASYARRPDLAAVREAEQLCLAAAQADETGEPGVEGLTCAIQAKAWLLEHGAAPAERSALAVSAVQAGQWCQRRAPGSAACRYWLAVALGLQSREKPTTAEDGVRRMVTLLREVVRTDPALDEAGPERILALVLLRAPGWPLGPGDAEEALSLARKAVALRAGYPPNDLALAEALEKTGDPKGARLALGRALESARAAVDAGNPDAPAWVREAEARLRR
jgi:hypothetical protein